MRKWAKVVLKYWNTMYNDFIYISLTCIYTKGCTYLKQLTGYTPDTSTTVFDFFALPLNIPYSNKQLVFNLKF